MNAVRRWTRAALVSGCAAAAACGELTSGGVGEAEVHVTADEPEGQAPAAGRAAAVPTGWGRAPLRQGSALVQGTLTASVQTFLRADGAGEWVEVTEGPTEITLDLAGQTERRAGAELLAEGRYSRFRIVFHDVEADVTGGLVVGGIPVEGEVSVLLGSDGTLTVEREVDVEVEAEGSVDVLVDLNAATWLAAVQLPALTVGEAALEAAVEVRVR